MAQIRRTELGDLPVDWPVDVLGDVATTSSGTTPPRSQQDRYFTNGSHAWVKTLDLTNGDVFATEEQVTDLALAETSLRVFSPGAVLVAMYGGFRQIGRTGLLRLPAAVNQAITAVQPDPTRLVSEYLLAVLNHRVEHWKLVASSSRKDPNITGVDVRSFRLPLPPVEEQVAIARAISDTDTLIDSLEQLLSKQRQIKQGAMQELLTGQRRLRDSIEPWKKCPFAFVLERINAKQYQVKASAYQDVGLLPVIDQGKSAVIGYTDRVESKFSCPDGGVIVFGDHTCIVKFVDFDFAVGADGVQLLAAKPSQSTRFHAYQLEFRGIEPTGYNRHFKFLQEREFVCPPEPEQHAIAQVLTDMDSALTALQSRLAKARELKQALMQVLLTGRIRLLPP